jgi:uncharacterized protein YecE (DUF72 family)
MSKPAAPADDLFEQPGSRTRRVRAGIGGWTYAPWRDNFYPAKLAQRRELEYASRHVSAIEVNGTYYGAQKPATYAKWRTETPDGFMFSLKAPRYTTDRKVLADAGKTIADFVDGGIAELGDRLGPINWQFPPYKAFDASDFAAFMDLLPRTLDGRALRHVFEVRHPSFLCTEYVELARSHRVASVFTDSAKHPSFADVTGDFVYLRLMGSEASIATGYPAAALDAWAGRARIWADGGEPDDLPRVAPASIQDTRRDVFVYFISAAKERNPAAAMSLLSRLQAEA